MQQPTQKEAAGYDLMVWVGDAGDVLTRSYSQRGVLALQALAGPKYKDGDVLEIVCQPEEFTSQIIPTAVVGYIDPRTNTIHKMPNSALH